MSLKGTLSLEIAQYQRDLAEAKRAMQSFGLDVSKADQNINKLSKSFDGDKIIQKAHEAAVAIQSVGGAAALTSKEAERMRKQLEEAQAKLQATNRGTSDLLNKTITDLQGVTKHTSAWGSAMGTVKNIAAGFVAGFTIDRVISGIGRAVTETIAWGGAITDLSAKTGVSMTALQKWEYAAKQSGNTLDQVVTASLQLSKRIEEGDKAVEQAIQGLGISLSSLRSMRPEQQFNAVAEALAKTSDQGERASAAMALFGRSGADLLPTLIADMKALGDEAERLGVVVDDKTLKAMDDLGDSWQKMKDAGRGLLAEVLSPMVPEMNRLAGAASNAAKAFREDFLGALFKVNEAARGGLFFGAMFGQQFAGAAPQAAQSPSGPPVAGVSTSEFFGTQNGLAGENVVAGVFMRDLVPAARESARALREIAAAAPTAAALLNRPGYFTEFLRTGSLGVDIRRGQLISQDLNNPWGGSSQITNAMGWNGGSLSAFAPRPGFNWGGLGLAGLNTAMPFLSQLITGGSRGGQIGGSIGGGLGGGIGSLFTGASGIMGALSGFLGPIGGIVGGLIGKLFGPSRGAILGKEADQRIGTTQAGLLQQFGSLDNIRAMGPYGSALADAWGSKNVAGEAWFNKLNEGLKEQLSLQEQIKSVEEQRKALVESLVPTWEQLTQAASRYGFDRTELGTQVQQLGSTETFKTILEDLDLFGRATDDVGAYLSRMSGQISVAVQQALRFGTEVPENMKPFIQNLLETGQLLDENGNAITDLSALRWGPAIQTQADIVREAIEQLNDTFDKLTEKLEELFDKLANGLPDAAARGAAGANSAFGQIEPVVPGGDRGVEGFANGSGGIRDFGRGTLAVLHGREAVLTERQLRNMGGGVAVTINVAGYLDSQVSRSHLASVVAAEIGRELRVRRRA